MQNGTQAVLNIEPVYSRYDHPDYPSEFADLGQYSEHDLLAGWTEVPLYAEEDVLELWTEIQRLKAEVGKLQAWHTPLGGLIEARLILKRAHAAIEAARDINTHIPGNPYHVALAALNPALGAVAELMLGEIANLKFLPMEDWDQRNEPVLLLVDYSEDGEHALDDALIAVTIGHNNDHNVGEDEGQGWRFAGWCWSHDHYTEGKGKPIGWLPLTQYHQIARGLEEAQL